MVERVEKAYEYSIDKKSHAVKYTAKSGDNVSCFLKAFAKEQYYQSSDNKITNKEWSQALNILKTRQKMTNINTIGCGQQITFSEDLIKEVMLAMGMSHAEKPEEKKSESWEVIQQKYRTINSLPNDKDKVIEWHKETIHTDKSNYVIVNKKDCTARVYSADGKELTSFEVGLGKLKGDDYLKKDRQMTSAGIYTIDYKGSGRDAYARKYGENIFTLKTDKGASGVALHQIPNGNSTRYAKMGNGILDDNRYSNGCINFTKNDFDKLEKYIGIKTKVYILPEDKNNSLIVKNGQLNLVQNQFTGQVLTSLKNSDSRAIQIRFNSNKHKSNETQKFVNTLQNKKSELMVKLNIDNDTYNNLAILSLGIAGQESNYGESLKYKAKENFPELISFIKNITGNKSCNSKGLTQIKINSYTDPEVRKILTEYKIDKNNLTIPENSAIATMIVLASMYKNELPKLAPYMAKLNIGKMDAMLYLWNGKKKEITKETATPSQNKYITNVKKYAYNNFNMTQA